MDGPTSDEPASASRTRRLGRRGEELPRLTPRSIGERRARQESGDRLDAVLCLVQAAVASRLEHYGLPDDIDPVEGWIAAT